MLMLRKHRSCQLPSEVIKTLLRMVKQHGGIHKMMYSLIFHWTIVHLIATAVVKSESFYSVIAPGSLKSHHKYNVIVSLHEAREPAAIKVAIDGPTYQDNHVVYLFPYQTVKVEFKAPKLLQGEYKLIAEGISGLKFRNESRLNVHWYSGPKIYIQTDKAIFKPGDEVQFRVLLLDEHTRPVEIQEPIRIDIIDGKKNRVKQFKDISVVKGIYKGKFQLSEHPVMGLWTIRVYISGNYDYTMNKYITVQHYILPKFSVYIKLNPHFVPTDSILKMLIYGKYTFDKYVEGNATVTLMDAGKVIRQQQLHVKDQQPVEFRFDNPDELKSTHGLSLRVELTEKLTCLTQYDKQFIKIHHQKYNIFVETDAILYKDGRPYRLRAIVQYWNDTRVSDRTATVHMNHGSKEYEAYLNANGEATFEFDHEPLAKHDFSFKGSTFSFANIYADKNAERNRTDIHCILKLMGDRPRLGVPVEIEVSSIDPIPYLVYTIVAHANIIQAFNIRLAQNQKAYVIRIIPSIEMIPVAFVYVHYVLNGNLHYGEIELKFPMEFENKIFIEAPKKVKPGQEVTLTLNAQPGSVVGVLAVDLGVYLLDPSYDLKRDEILKGLINDRTYLPIAALVYPGILAGVLSFTNAHYEFQSFSATGVVAPTSFGPLKFRNKFPETWIFENYNITNNNTQLTLPIPDTITTWRITAFTINDRSGFGIVDGPTDITSVQTFFINLNLPYSVKRGEIVAIPVLAYNYHNYSLNTEIKFYNPNKEFDFMTSNIFAGFRITHKEYQSHRVIVAPNSVENVKFFITPKQVGELNLTIVAINSFASDAIVQQLKVEPEGITERHNVPLYIGVQPGQRFTRTLSIQIAPNRVPLSEFITLSVGGSTLIPTLKNLNSLVLLPTGCGEQNMVNFAPNILVLQYLRTMGKHFMEKEVVDKAKRFIDIGYQQQLSYRHTNGGYSVFGQRTNDVPSTWLTAYVIRFFIKATQYLAIEGHIVGSGLEFLSQNQAADGSFMYTGYLFYPAQQNRYGFTAFVLMTFLEQRKYAEQYKSPIAKGLHFLSNNIDKVNDIYALAIMVATLQMAKHQKAKGILDKLQLQKRTSPEMVWWSQADRNLEKDVEITAYILMALLDTDDHNPKEALHIFKWLTEQRNERGGFKSTHDTVVGLQALLKFSEKYSDASNMSMRFKYTVKNQQTDVIHRGEWRVDGNNMMILQTEELSKSARSIDIEATGNGHSLLQLSYCYHVVNNETFKHFYIRTVPKMLNSVELLLDICFLYPQPKSQVTEGALTNMIIIEVNLPSGFTSSDEFSKDLLDIEIVERVESKNDETTLVIYFEKLAANVENCFNILASKMHEVPMRKPVSISIYDYYNISRHDTVFYNI